MIAVKKQLYEHCRQFLQQRITAVWQALREAQSSANEETKSSSGDKYETGRAMAQLEVEKNSVQLSEAMSLKNKLDQIDPAQQSLVVWQGSLVITDRGNFFLSISVGQIIIENTTYLAVSAESPIGMRLKGLKQGDLFTFLNKTYKIEQVW